MTAVSSGRVGWASSTGADRPRRATRFSQPSGAEASPRSARATTTWRTEPTRATASWTGPRNDSHTTTADRLGVLQLEGQLVGGEQHVEGHDRVAGVVGAEVGDAELRHVRQHEGHVLAGPHAQGGQAAGEQAGEEVEAGVVDVAVADDDRGAGRVPGGRVGQDGCEVQGTDRGA